MSSRYINGTHHKKPILVGGGLWDDVPTSIGDQFRSPYKVCVEDWNVAGVDGTLEARGASLSDLNTATAPTETVASSPSPALVISAGVGADSGTQVCFIDAPSGATTASPPFKGIGPITPSANTMNYKEFIFDTRVGFQVAAADWNSKALIGFGKEDATPLDSGTGEITHSGGFTGFHIREDGTIGYANSVTAITSSTTIPGYDLSGVLSSSNIVWFKFGFRIRYYGTVSNSEVVTDFYVNNKHVATESGVNGALASTGPHGETFAVMNGATSLLTKLNIDYVATGITRDGLSYPYGDPGDIY